MRRAEAEEIARDNGHTLGAWMDKACVGESPLWVARCACGAVRASDTGEGELLTSLMIDTEGVKRRCGVSTNVRERLAALEHEQWAHWTRFLLDHLTPETIERWRRQCDTPYAALTEAEKDQDREWADKVLAILHGEGA